MCLQGAHQSPQEVHRPPPLTCKFGNRMKTKSCRFFFRSTTSVQPHLVRCQITEASLEDNSDEVSSPLLMKSNCNKKMNPMIWP